MKGTDAVPAQATLEILRFRMGGVALGAMVQQIDFMTFPPEQQADGTGVVWLSEVLDFRGLVTSWRAPKALHLDSHTGTHAVIIDNPEEIVTIHPDEIQYLPDYLLTRAAQGAILGAFIAQDGTPVLLLDLQALCRRTREVTSR